MKKIKRVFVQKTYGPQLYKWSPETNIVRTKNQTTSVKKPYYCNATTNSQGQDWISTYSYNIVVLGGQQQRIAYVECDYVL